MRVGFRFFRVFLLFILIFGLGSFEARALSVMQLDRESRVVLQHLAPQLITGLKGVPPQVVQETVSADEMADLNAELDQPQYERLLKELHEVLPKVARDEAQRVRQKPFPSSAKQAQFEVNQVHSYAGSFPHSARLTELAFLLELAQFHAEMNEEYIPKLRRAQGALRVLSGKSDGVDEFLETFRSPGAENEPIGLREVVGGLRVSIWEFVKLSEMFLILAPDTHPLGRGPTSAHLSPGLLNRYLKTGKEFESSLQELQIVFADHPGITPLKRQYLIQALEDDYSKYKSARQLLRVVLQMGQNRECGGWLEK